MGNSIKNRARPTIVRLAYTWHYYRGKCEKMQPFSSVVLMKTAVLWHMLTVHSSQCHLRFWKMSQNPHPVGPFAQYLLDKGAQCCLLARYLFYAKHLNTRSNKGENSWNFSREKKRWNVVDESNEKYFEPGRLVGVVWWGMNIPDTCT